jgi:hypothetical protein
MEQITLPATALPNLSGTIKDAINFGLWFLYEISYSKDLNAKYSLATSRGEFLLTQDGDVISVIPENAPKDLNYLSQITFSGIPSAPVINMPTL